MKVTYSYETYYQNETLETNIFVQKVADSVCIYLNTENQTTGGNSTPDQLSRQSFCAEE